MINPSEIIFFRSENRHLMAPGPGWKHLCYGVWEHNSKARIHIGGGVIRLPDKKTYLTLGHWYEGETGRKLVKINGCNRKRGLMAWAVWLVAMGDDEF